MLLLDNGRTRLLADREKRQSLYCIRCGACLNTCPVYRKIGGHSFPWVYSGPIGAIITPQFLGVHRTSPACRSPPACAAPAPRSVRSRSIFPKILLDLRSDVKKAEARDGTNRLERLVFRIWAWVMCHPRIYEMAGMMARAPRPCHPGRRDHGWMREVPGCDLVPPLRGWLSERDLPPPPPRSFRQMWRQR